MKYEVNQIVIGKVINVKPYALFLQFDDGIEGLLHISEISDSFIRDIERFGTIGDEIKVKIISIDETNGFMRVSLKQVPADEAYSSHTNVRKNIIHDENDFLPLKEKLPIWIEKTLKKAKS